jgi:hypothetical protein
VATQVSLEPESGRPFRTFVGVQRRRARANGLRSAAAIGEKRMDLSEEIAWFANMLNFGVILNMDGPLVKIGSRSVFGNSVVGGWQ